MATENNKIWSKAIDICVKTLTTLFKMQLSECWGGGTSRLGARVRGREEDKGKGQHEGVKSLSNADTKRWDAVASPPLNSAAEAA